jgi:hypothetical protein
MILVLICFAFWVNQNTTMIIEKLDYIINIEEAITPDTGIASS